MTRTIFLKSFIDNKKIQVAVTFTRLDIETPVLISCDGRRVNFNHIHVLSKGKIIRMLDAGDLFTGVLRIDI